MKTTLAGAVSRKLTVVPRVRPRVENRLREARTPGAYDRYRVGLHHLAFQAPSREVVDERVRWARAQGVEIENDPKEYGYMPGYYAGFFRDPDGIKLEVLHVPE